jgi:biotin synthase
MPEHPESFPVNALVPIPGTPLEANEVGHLLSYRMYILSCIVFQPVRYHTLVRTIATARIVLPTTIIRLAAGRNTLAESEQAMCFMAGANAVFTGEQMLTTPCESRAFALGMYNVYIYVIITGSPWDEDKAMMSRWGLEGMQSFEQVNVARKEGSRLLTTSLDPVSVQPQK